MIVFIDQNWYLDWYWVGFLNGNWHWSLDVHGVRPVNGHFDGHGYWPFYFNGNVLVYGIGLWHGYFDRHCYGPLNMDGVRPVYGHVYGVRNGFLNWDSDWYWLFNGVRCWHMDGVRPVNGNLYWYTNVFNNWVRLWYGYFDFDGVRHVLFNGVGLGNWYLNGVRDVFLNGVGLRYENFDGVGPVDGDMDGVWHLLFYWVWCRYVYGDLHVFLNVDGHMLDYFVGLRNWDLDGVRDVLLYWVRHWSVNWHCYWDSLDEGDGPGHIGAASKVDAVSGVSIRSFI